MRISRKQKQAKQKRQKEKEEKQENIDSSASQYDETHKEQYELQAEYHDEMEILKKFGI